MLVSLVGMEEWEVILCSPLQLTSPQTMNNESGTTAAIETNMIVMIILVLKSLSATVEKRMTKYLAIKYWRKNSLLINGNQLRVITSGLDLWKASRILRERMKTWMESSCVSSRSPRRMIFQKRWMTQSQWMAKTSNFHNLEDKQIVHAAFEEEICFFFYSFSLFGWPGHPTSSAAADWNIPESTWYMLEAILFQSTLWELKRACLLLPLIINDPRYGQDFKWKHARVMHCFTSWARSHTLGLVLFSVICVLFLIVFVPLLLLF